MSGSNPTQFHTSPEAQAYFEGLLNQRLQEQERNFLHAVQARELELEADRLERERAVAANDAKLRQSLENTNAQLATLRLQSPCV